MHRCSLRCLPKWNFRSCESKESNMEAGYKMMSRLGVALFGVGRIGQVHLQNLVFNNKVEVRWLVDVKEVHPDIQEVVKQLRLGEETQITTPDNIDKVLSDKWVSIVLVCTTTSTHEEIIRKALCADKHVFCEKPLASTLEAVKKCYEEAEKHNKILFCALNRRFHDQLFAVHNKIRQGDLGQIRLVRMTSRDRNPPKNYLRNNGGGIYFDMGIHDLDYICWLIGKRPLSVSAIGATSPESPDEYRELNEYDSAVAILKFPDNIIAYSEVSRESCYGYEQTIEVLGTKKCVKSNNGKLAQLEELNNDGAGFDFLDDTFQTRYHESYKTEMKHFLNVVEGKEENIVTAESCILGIEVSGHVTEALKSGKTIIIPNDQNV